MIISAAMIRKAADVDKIFLNETKEAFAHKAFWFLDSHLADWKIEEKFI